jgi:mxaJ protein
VIRVWLLLGTLALAPSVRAQALTVCADPNNLPFSNREQAGFENKLVTLIAADLKLKVHYEWWAQRRGFARNTLANSRCDLWPGVATGIGSMASSSPYYRSTYVFVTRRDSGLHDLSLNDERLRTLTIGVQLIGDDAMNTPPAHALAERGITANVRGYMLYGDYHRPNPPAAIVAAVASRAVDVAVVWGPLAGYFASRAPVRLRLEPVEPQADHGWPMTYQVSVGVRRDEPELLQQINVVLRVERPAIEQLLRAYAVPIATPIAPTNVVGNAAVDPVSLMAPDQALLLGSRPWMMFARVPKQTRNRAPGC